MKHSCKMVAHIKRQGACARNRLPASSNTAYPSQYEVIEGREQRVRSTLALLDHPRVNAAVIAQPALPMRFWWHTDEDRASLGLSADDLQIARQSTAKVYGLRFETDCMADRAKHLTLRHEFGERFHDGEIPVSAYRPNGEPINVHSTLIGSWKASDATGQPSRNAQERVRTFLLKELLGSRPEG